MPVFTDELEVVGESSLFREGKYYFMNIGSTFLAYYCANRFDRVE
jgi:hypothetical protein